MSPQTAETFPSEQRDLSPSATSSSENRSIYIIGVGVFGLSFMRYIASSRPNDNVLAFDSKEKQSACNDTHKILRDQYASIHRTHEATKAHEGWKRDPNLRPYVHDIGRVEITDDIDTLNAIDANLPVPRERLTEDSITKKLEDFRIPSEDRRCLEYIMRLLKTANDPKLVCVWNKDNAVVNWNQCIQNIREPLSSRIREEKVERLVADDTGRVCALQMGNVARVVIEDGASVILTAGAWGQKLLKDSNIAGPPPAKSFRAIAVFTFHLRLSESHWAYIRGLPALSFKNKIINCSPTSRRWYNANSPPGEFLPALHKDGLAKLGLTFPFTNVRNEPEDVSESDLMYRVLERAMQWVLLYYPELKGAKVVAKELHWDAVTQDQTPLISWHPGHRNLGIAGGASFTRAKDLPTIGETMSNIFFEGQQPGEFGWHSPPIEDKVQHNQRHLFTTDNFEDLENEAAKDEAVQICREAGPDYYI